MSTTTKQTPTREAEVTPNLNKRLEDFAKIQDILFGDQVTDLETRLNALEQTLNETNTQLDKSFSTKLSNLELEHKEELTKLNAWLKTEEASRQADKLKLEKALNEHVSKLENSLSAYKAETQSALENLRNEQAQALENLAQENQKAHENLDAKFNAAVEKLSHEKTDRQALAGLFKQLAETLSA